MVGETGSLTSHNMFIYSNNNPVNMEDPSGFSSVPSTAKGYQYMNQIYKAYPGFVKNTKSFLTSYGKRIPDFANKYVIGEIKNVKYQSYSSQIKGFIEIARDEGKTFVLVIDKATKLSKPIMKAIDDAEGRVVRVASKRALMPIIVSKKQLDIFMRQSTNPNSYY